MKLNKYIVATLVLYSLFLFAVMGLVSAEIQSIGAFKQSDCVQLPQSCTNCTFNNITSITFPNGSLALSGNFAMTKIASRYNYSYCLTQLGTYVVDGFNDYQSWGYRVIVTKDGRDIAPWGTMIAFYIFFLIGCCAIMYFSARLIIKNSIKKDWMSEKAQYETRKASEFSFYLDLIKRKLWIVGVFGVYLAFAVFISIFADLSYILNLTQISTITSSFSTFLFWMFIPFILFWICYIIIYFIKATNDVLKYQFGGFSR